MRNLHEDDYEELQEILDDAICDGEGRLYSDHLVHHLKKHGMPIVIAESEDL